MSRTSPLTSQHQKYLQNLAGTTAAAASGNRPGAATGQRIAPQQLQTIAYGPEPSSREGAQTCAVPALFDTVETEYGSLRRGAGIMDCPHRGTVVVTGSERIDFLNRMLTQQFADAQPGTARQSFVVNRKGRILADLFVVVDEDRVWIDVDVHQAAAVVESLEQFLFAEDVELEDATERVHRISVHGPNAVNFLGLAADRSDFSLEVDGCDALTIAGAEVVIGRRDQVGDAGCELLVAVDDAPKIWQALVDAADGLNGDGVRMHRPVGWHAWNIARIEAGMPMMNIDFDTTSLPHETSVVDSRVSFRKGCYPGQEVVARMQNLGGPKQRLVGLRVQGDVLPMAGTEVFAKPAEDSGGSIGDPVGVVTSSTLSPMLSAQPIALAMVRMKQVSEDGVVVVAAEGETAEAKAGPLQFWSRTASVAS